MPPDWVRQRVLIVGAAGQKASRAHPGAGAIHHIPVAGACSWDEFARAIFQFAELEIEASPQTSAAPVACADRPRYSVLANRALRAAGIDHIRSWAEGLQEYLIVQGYGERASLPAR